MEMLAVDIFVWNTSLYVFLLLKAMRYLYNLMHLKCYKYRKAYINDILQLDDVRLSQFLPARSPSVSSLFSSMLLLKF